MKRLVTLITVLISLHCTLDASNNFSIPLQDTIVGYFDFEQLQTPPYNTWFEYEYDNYNLDTTTLDKPEIKALDKVDIIVVIGTWCPDSQRETPRLVKILNYLDYNTKNIIAIGVNRKKEAPFTEVKDLNIDYVPTFIFLYDGKEIGRIIESPEESLEKDILKIVSAI